MTENLKGHLNLHTRLFLDNLILAHSHGKIHNFRFVDYARLIYMVLKMYLLALGLAIITVKNTRPNGLVFSTL